MKTLADVKRAMVIGSVWVSESPLWRGAPSKTRTVTKVTASGVGFDTLRADESRVVSWVYFPKAADVKFVDGWVEFWGEWQGGYQLLGRHKKV